MPITVAGILEWASDENYPAGSDPWSGTPTKVPPTAETQAHGFTPEGPASAQQINAQLNALTQIAKGFQSAFLGHWLPVKAFPAGVMTADPDQDIESFTSLFWNRRERCWYMPGIGGAWAMGKTRNFMSWDAVFCGLAQFNGVIGAANNNVTSANYGDIVVGSLFNIGGGPFFLRKMSAATGVWSNISLGSSNEPFQIKHDPVNATWIVLVRALEDVFCFTCPDTTYVFTARSMPGSPQVGITPFFGGAAYGGALVISDTGIAVYSDGKSGHLWVSTDGGTTWADNMPPSSILANTLVWVPGTREFLGCDATSLYASADGVTWELRASQTPFNSVNTLGAVSNGGAVVSMAALGNTVWCTWISGNANVNAGTDTDSGGGGLGVSYDAGRSWQFCGPAQTRSVGATTYRRAYGRLFAGDDAVGCTHLVGSDPGNTNGYTFLTGLATIPIEGALP